MGVWKLRFTHVLSFLLIGFLLFLSSCEEERSKQNDYQGSDLTIGVIGTVPDYKLNNITYIKEKLSDMKSNEYKYDAYIITKDNFQKASKQEYKKKLIKLDVPVFFIGLADKPYFIYTGDSEKTYNEAFSHPEFGYTQGFMKKGMKIYNWQIYLDDALTQKEQIRDMYISLFNIINNIKSGEMMVK